MTIWSMAFLALCVGWGTAINSVTEMAPTSWSDLLLAGTLMGAPIFLATGLSAGLTYAITKNRAKAFSAWTLPLLLAVMALSIGNTEVLRNEAETQSRPLEGDEIKSYVERLQRDIRTPSETTQYIDELLAEYRTNQFAAKARYESTAEDACSSFVSKGRCKRVDVIALVDHRWRDASGQTVLSLLTKQGETISAEFASGTTAADLRDAHSGRKVVVRCESTYVQGHLRLSGCLLIWLAPK
jgi:hypothetical protein